MPVKNIIPGQHVTKEKLQRAKELRREMTPAEKILWEELRGSKLGVHFRRQQVIEGFIVDFYCHKTGLVVEVDGDVHDLQRNMNKFESAQPKTPVSVRRQGWAPPLFFSPVIF
jgi:very-short-patch-repair endonuclease